MVQILECSSLVVINARAREFKIFVNLARASIMSVCTSVVGV